MLFCVSFPYCLVATGYLLLNKMFTCVVDLNYMSIPKFSIIYACMIKYNSNSISEFMCFPHDICSWGKSSIISSLLDPSSKFSFESRVKCSTTTINLSIAFKTHDHLACALLGFLPVLNKLLRHYVVTNDIWLYTTINHTTTNLVP